LLQALTLLKPKEDENKKQWAKSREALITDLKDIAPWGVCSH
jgi:hypothetical protein